MRYLALLFIGLVTTHRGASQITGNPKVKDPHAIVLDSASTKKLAGKWECTGYEENIKGTKSVNANPEIIFDIKPEGTYTQKACTDCNFTRTGTWEVTRANTVKFSVDDAFLRHENKLQGTWAVYALTDSELTLTRILTSSADWTKQFKFRKLAPPERQP